MIFALGGNQNCGKTTLFNQLTGSNQHVGNFPGVTVEGKSGKVKGHPEVSIVDLPGIYSLSPYTSEEIVTRDFLINDKIDCIINITDATNIERNLYLSLQLMELDIPMVIALNMMDEMRENGNTIKTNQLSEDLGVPVVPLAAVKNEGVDELIEIAIETAIHRRKPAVKDFCSGAVHRAIHSVAHLVEDHADRINVPSRFAATKLIEGDEPMLNALRLSDNEKEMLEHIVTEMERETDTDREAALADMRYTFIERICARSVVKNGESKAHGRSVKIDSVLTHKIWSLPIFIGIMGIIFWLTFGVIGAWLSAGFTILIDSLVSLIDHGLTLYGINPVVHSLVINGVCAGVGSVLSFLPTIVVLFFFLSMLEDSGYMARVAFVMDKALRKIGLSGRSFVPMVIGFGCSVPAIMASRTLPSDRDRKMTIILTPFMSCSAKLPIYTVFVQAFFPVKYRALVMIGLYIFGMVMGVVVGFIMKKTAFHGEPVPFVMELPNYRMPGLKSVFMLIWSKAKDFITKAFTVIFTASVIIWFLQTFDTRFNVVADSSLSMLALIGHLVSPIFRPLGFGDWRAATALITGFTAKEAVISTLSVLVSGDIGTALQGLFTTQAAITFLVFTLLYTPCVAAIAAVKRELHSGLWAAAIACGQTVFAWCVAFAVYNIIMLF
ncbi:MAG: ferrous iron transport protein B [Candidatus Metalachnospira sp.]|nr:ferrous iron transport protein B [Candidatus Metalachnospira sp.]